MHGDQVVFEGTSGVIIPKALCEIARVSPPLLLKQSSGDLMGVNGDALSRFFTLLALQTAALRRDKRVGPPSLAG